MKELTKATMRRFHDVRYATRWFTGDAIDIGAGDDPLTRIQPYFPLLKTVTCCDKEDGDAMLMDWVADGTYDTVHSSNCLEHCVDPFIALKNWVRICRKGGHIIVTIPDEDLYEQGIFPSTFNADHKWTFTIGKTNSWSHKSVNVIQLLGQVVDEVKILKVELLDAGFVYGLPRQDQTLGLLSESSIEFVLEKI
ncbi:MAG: methyltransferase domain-containing protein [Bdellovibrionales bacterium]